MMCYDGGMDGFMKVDVVCELVDQFNFESQQ